MLPKFKKCKISIITVCYNSQETILDTINSVQQQCYGNREHIIIDGASTDGTLALLKQQRRRFDVFISEPDQGIYDAMNKGIQMATGDVIGFLNADDVLDHPTVLQEIATGFQNPEVQAVYSDLVYVARNDLNVVKRYWEASPFKPGLFAKGWLPPHPTFYVRREVYQQWGGFDVSLPIGNDAELMMRFLECARLRTAYIHKTWVRMRVGGVSNKSLKNILHQNYVILKSFRKHRLSVNPLVFMFAKLGSRLAQRFLREKLS